MWFLPLTNSVAKTMICVLVAPHRKQDLEFWYVFYHMYHSQNCQAGQLAKPNVTSIFSENRCISDCLYLSHQVHLHYHYLCCSSPKWNLLPFTILYKPISIWTLQLLSPLHGYLQVQHTQLERKSFIMCLLSQPLLQTPDGRLHRKDE